MTETSRNGAGGRRQNGADGYRHPVTTLKPVATPDESGGINVTPHLSLLDTATERVVDSVASIVPDEESFARDAYIAALELRIRELVEIERMRDLEIRNLEAEAGQQADRIHSLEVALFHAERRAADLDRRWNDLALVYEKAAAALVVAGGKLEQIHHQTGYRAILALNRLARRASILKRIVGRSRSIPPAPVRGDTQATQ